MKTISRELGQRMWGGSGTIISGGSGVGGGESGVSAAWVNQNFLTKEFFNQLFSIHGFETVYTSDDDGATWTQDGDPTEITLLPNEIHGEVIEDGETAGTKIKTVRSLKDIQSLKGFWTNFYVSALGLSSGGGGGGATALSDLVDVAISSPTNGQVLMYNETTQKWYNGTVQSGGGSVTSITAGTGLSGGTITSSGTIALSTETQTNIGKGVTAYGWGDHAQVGYATQTWVGKQGFLTGITSQMVTNALGYTPLSNTATWWGRSVSSNVVVGNIDMNNGDAINFKNSGGTPKSVLTLNQNNILIIGYGTNNSNYATQLRGAGISFYTYNNSAELNVGEFSKSGRFWIKQATQGLRIGDGLLTWDASNNSLKVSDASGNAANLYALGGISALGFSSSGGTSSINSLTVNDSILVKDYAGESKKALSVTLPASATDASILIIGDGWNTAYHDTVIKGHNIRFDAGSISSAVTINGSGFATFNYYLKSGRYYLDASRYLYLDASNVLKYNDNGTVRTIAFS